MLAKGYIPLIEEANTVHKINSVPEKNKTCSLFSELSLITAAIPGDSAILSVQGDHEEAWKG